MRLRLMALLVGLSMLTLLQVAPANAALHIPARRGPVIWSTVEQGATVWVATADSPLSTQTSCRKSQYWCEFNTTYVYGVNSTTIGYVYIEADLQLDYPNNRDVDNLQESETISGPAINAEHQFHCVDHHTLSNTSCGSGDHTHGAFQTALWKWPNTWSTYLNNNDQYWMNWNWWWQAQGYPYIWASDTFTSTHWNCYQGANCHM